VRFIALGHSLREAKCRAAVIVIDCLVISTIMGYRFGDAERERQPAICYSGPATRSMTRPGNCGTVPECVDRDGMLLHCQPGPAQPASGTDRNGIPGRRRRASAAAGSPVLVRW
jgi:hypothetical protein